MRVKVADPHAAQGVLPDEQAHFIIGGDVDLRQPLQRVGHFAAMSEIAERQLRIHHRMTRHPAVVEDSDEIVVDLPEVVDPDRRIDQDHAGSERRRGVAFGSGPVPPRRARRFALSRSIIARSAYRTNADSAEAPVGSCAFDIRSSSMARVVRVAHADRGCTHAGSH
ncbi:MAG: hypothetical protein KDH15_05880 [Rhodocyclaceae bacterium]|nr:hypothetical protein [Rhodocyclaceae bacterium]